MDIIAVGNLKGDKTNKNKKQIVLIHTSREVNEYLTSLKYRHNGNYDKIPNYVIDKEGKILQLLEPDQVSNIFNSKTINENVITISLENLGWLEKEPLKNHYINWIGNIYNGKVFEKHWRDYIFWDTYTKKQIESTIFLCKKLTQEYNIDKKFVGHNTKINGINNFSGIVSRSNYFTESTDLNPSLNFDFFLKEIEDE
jgi:N-acetyl-anhydromuramyl-L-alanine amidase AmpD